MKVSPFDFTIYQIVIHRRIIDTSTFCWGSQENASSLCNVPFAKKVFFLETVRAEKNSPEIQKAIDFFAKVCYNQFTMKQVFSFKATHEYLSGFRVML